MATTAIPARGADRDMTALERRVSLGAVLLPAAAFAAAVVLLWNRAVDWRDLAILAVMYIGCAFGVTIGYHRLFTHRSYSARRPLQYALAVLGSMSAQGPLASWVADHRKHHAHTDREGDPHSPHVHEHGEGVRGVVLGLAHAHFGWLLSDWGRADRGRYARDIVEDPVLDRISKSFVPIVLAGLAIPALAGFALTGTLLGAAGGLLWGGLVRVFLLHHVTWSINSICHCYGRRRFDVEDRSTNVAWLALPSLGEAWHHNHHAFPRSAEHGLRWWEIDPSAWAIRALELVGLASNVVRITPERQRQLTSEPRR